MWARLEEILEHCVVELEDDTSFWIDPVAEPGFKMAGMGRVVAPIRNLQPDHRIGHAGNGENVRPLVQKGKSGGRLVQILRVGVARLGHTPTKSG